MLPRPCLVIALATLVAGEAVAQTPEGVLSLSRLLARTDTVESYVRQGPAAPVRSGYYERIVSGSAEVGWVAESRWFDTTGAWVSTQRTVTRPGGIATRAEQVRGLTDSASVLITDGRGTGWIVPQGQLARLVDGALTADFANPDVALLAVAASRPSPGMVFVVPQNRIFSANPLAVTTDTLRALAPARIRYRGREVECQTIVGTQGRTFWVERTTGRLLARRTTVGPMTYWQVVAGVTPPEL